MRLVNNDLAYVDRSESKLSIHNLASLTVKYGDLHKENNTWRKEASPNKIT